MDAPFLSFEPHNTPLSGTLTDAFFNMYDSYWYILGKEEKQFEKEYAAFKYVTHTFGSVNGFSALALALQVRDMDLGNEVIMHSNTYNPAGRDAGRSAARTRSARHRLTGGRLDAAYPRRYAIAPPWPSLPHDRNHAFGVAARSACD